MNLHKITAMTTLAGLAFGLGLVLATSADAATKKQQRATKYIYYGTQDRFVSTRGRGPTRLTVYRRSFLSGGTETLQRDQHYTDYSHPPNYIPYIDRNDPKVSFSRMGLPDPWDIPGWPKY
jgi:hypothetical protein